VIPKEIRRQAGLGLGTRVGIRSDRDHIENEPVPPAVSLEYRGHLRVGVPETDIPPLSSEIVEATLETVRQERGAEV
jgi:bifunctional DNA-binding transcriptional regulator/antitoxin component of YhaV-PrlF toxin-antitoxin module